MKNLFNVMQQYAAKFQTGITSDGVRMQSAFGIETDGTIGSDVVSEQYGRSSFLRKRREPMTAPPLEMPSGTPPMPVLDYEDMLGWDKESKEERPAIISKIDWTNMADDENDSFDSDDEDDYVSLFPDEIRWKGITLEHGIPYSRKMDE